MLNVVKKAGGVVVLWPDLNSKTNRRTLTSVSTETHDLNGMLPTSGIIEFSLYLVSGTAENSPYTFVESVRGPYNLERALKTGPISRTYKKAFARRLRLKFPGRDDSIKNMHVFRMRAQSVYVLFVVEVEEGSQTGFLRDIEFAIPEKFLERAFNASIVSEISTDATFLPAPIKTQLKFYCDPTSISDAVGLAMALEHLRVHDPKSAQTKQREERAAVVRAHAHDLLDHPDVERTRQSISDKVHTSLYGVVNDLMK